MLGKAMKFAAIKGKDFDCTKKEECRKIAVEWRK